MTPNDDIGMAGSPLDGRGRRSSAGHELRVLSLAVFEAVLVRRCGAPEARFLWLGRRLRERGLIPSSPEAFARARRRVEAEVAERDGWFHSGVAIEAFYREVVRVLRLDPALVSTLAAEELALEEEVLRPTRQARELLEWADAAGLDVVFTADTYSAEFVRSLLASHGLWPRGARCFASSELRGSPAGGTRLETIASELDVPQSSILYIGGVDCDRRSAATARVPAPGRPDAGLNRYEQLLDEARWESAGMTAAFAGASRVARLEAPDEDERVRALREVAAGVAGPLLVGYVLWVLHRARDLGLERLYFVARDGQVLQRLASILVGRLGWEVDARYLYASRRSVNLAAVHDTTLADLEWAFRHAEGAPLGDVLRRLGVRPFEIADELAAAGHFDCDDSTPLTAELRRTLEREAGNGVLRPLILGRAEAQRTEVCEFLRQEGLLDEVRPGIVDLGGVGSQARALHELVTRSGGSAPRFFFLGLDESPDQRVAAAVRTSEWLENSESFLFDQPRRQGIRSFRGLNTAFQMFCAADHGTVLGYRRNGDRIEPVLDTGGGSEALAGWGLATVRETLERFAEELVLAEDLVDPGGPLGLAVASVVLEFMRSPTTAEARAWGAFPFEGAEVVSPGRRALASPYTWAAVMSAAADGSILRGTFPDSSWSSWHEGSVALTGSQTLRRGVEAAARARRALKESRSPWARGVGRLVRRARATSG